MLQYLVYTMNFSRLSQSLKQLEKNINSMESLLVNLLEDHHATLDIRAEYNKHLNKTISELKEELSQPPNDLLSSDTTDEALNIVAKMELDTLIQLENYITI